MIDAIYIITFENQFKNNYRLRYKIKDYGRANPWIVSYIKIEHFWMLYAKMEVIEKIYEHRRETK